MRFNQGANVMNKFVLSFTFLLQFLIGHMSVAIEIPLNTKHISIKTPEANFITTHQTKARTVIHAKALITRDICLQEERDTWETTCEDCRQDLVCQAEDQCQYVWNCKTYACTKSDTYCVQWGKHSKMEDVKIKFSWGFLGLFRPRPGKLIEVRIPSKDGESDFAITTDGITKNLKMNNNNTVKVRLPR